MKWTKERPTKDGYYWHKDEDGRILILEWDENMEWGMETGSDIMWTYEGWGQELADGWWWPEEIIFNVED